MSRRVKPWFVLALVLPSLLSGYALARLNAPGGDLLDAVAAVQRRSPAFMASDRRPIGDWLVNGAVYLCRKARTPDELDSLGKQPSRPDPRWEGVVCFRGTADPNEVYVPWVSDGGDRCVRYGAFAVYGDRDMLREVRAALADAGFRPQE